MIPSFSNFVYVTIFSVELLFSILASSVLRFLIIG